MHIDFHPPLGSRTLVPTAQLAATVPPASADETRKTEYVDVALIARLTPGDYAALVGAGVRVEVWTNACGAWDAVPFVADEDDEDYCPGGPSSSDSNQPVLHLTPDASLVKTTHLHSPSEPGMHVLRARLRLRADRDAAFTYRLIYPSGMRWLGSAREDGALVPTRSADAFFVGEGTWADGCRVRSAEDGSDEALVGWLDVRDWEWRGWAVDEGGESIFAFTDVAQLANRRARLLYFLPTSTPGTHSLVVPQAQLLRVTSPACALAVAIDGSVVLQAPATGTVERWVLPEPSSEIAQHALREALISAGRAPEVAMLGGACVLIVPDANGEAGAGVTVCTLARGPDNGHVVVPVDALSVFAPNASTLALYALQTHEVLFVERDSISAGVSLALGAEPAATFTVCVAHTLEDKTGGLNSSFSPVVFALPSHLQLTPTLVEIAPASIPTEIQEQARTLPTPPASPTRTPRRTPSISFVLPPSPPSGARSPRTAGGIRPPPMAQARRPQPSMPRALPLQFPFPISLPRSFPREPLNALRDAFALIQANISANTRTHAPAASLTGLSLGALLGAAFVAARARAAGAARFVATALGILALRALVGALGWVVARRPGGGVPRRLGSGVSVRDVAKRDEVMRADSSESRLEAERKSGSDESDSGSESTTTSPALSPIPIPSKGKPALRWYIPAHDSPVLAVSCSPSVNNYTTVEGNTKSSTDGDAPHPELEVQLDGVRAALKPLYASGGAARVYRVVPLFVSENASGGQAQEVVLQVGLRAHP